MEALYAQAIFEVQEQEIKIIGREIRGGLEPADLVGDKGWKVFQFRRALKQKLLEIMRRAQNFGIGQVNDELKRQRDNPRREPEAQA